MKISSFLRFTSLLITVALCACTEDPSENAAAQETDIAASKIIYNADNANRGELLVKFSSGSLSLLERNVTRSGNTRSGVAGVDAVMSKINAVSIERLFPVDVRNEAKTRQAGLDLWYIIYFSDQISLQNVAEQLADVADVTKVQYNIRVNRIDKRPAVPCDEFDLVTPHTMAAGQFNDPKLAKQWHYINTGDESVTTPTKAGADVNCAEAWKLCTGDPSIIVAVVDEGIKYNHEDLAANMWVNRKEQDGQTNTDNDGNGYKNDIHGYNFVNNRGTISPGDHGTHVAGTISAVNNNGKGVCGVAGGSGNDDGVKIMSCQIFNGDDGASTSNTAKAIKYAADNGALILQCSWGYDPDVFKNEMAWYNSVGAEKEAIDYFVINAGSEIGVMTGGIAIFSAGNEYAGSPGYPSAYSKVISVAAMSSDFTPSSFTNYGTAVDITAPGGDSDYSKSENGTILSTLATSSYGYMEGTSMSCPHVSGVAALGLSYAKKMGKRYTAAQFKSLLLASVNDIDQYFTGTKTYYYEYLYGDGKPRTVNLSSYVKKMGSGYVDAHKLLLAVKGVPAIMVHPGEKKTVNMSIYFGGSSSKSYFVRVSNTAAQEAMGLEVNINEGVLEIVTKKQGCATLILGTTIGGVEEKREVVVISKSNMADNGGWM